MGKLPHSISSGSQYTHSEWESSNLDHLHNADQSRHTAERIRAEVAPRLLLAFTLTAAPRQTY